MTSLGLSGARRAERVLVVLVSLHSLLVAVALLAAPRAILAFGGWSAAADGDLFFPRQGGAFHLVLALAYLVEHFRHGGVTILVLAKTVAALFLLGSAAAAGGGVAWAIPFSGATDLAMGIVVLLAHRRAARAD